MTQQTAHKERLLTLPFLGICLVNLLVFVNFHALLLTFLFYITALGGDALAIGLATALFSIASILSRPFVGWLVDTRGRRLILLAGLAGLMLVPMGYIVSAGVALAIILCTAHGVFHAAASNATSTWVTDIVPQSRMGEGLGIYGLSMAISTALAPALALALMHAYGYTPLFALTAAVALVALAIIFCMHSPVSSSQETVFKVGQLFEPMSVPASITQFFFMMAYGVVGHPTHLQGGGGGADDTDRQGPCPALPALYGA